MPRKKKRRNLNNKKKIDSRTAENISLIDKIKKSKAYIFLTTLFLFSVTLFGAFYQPFTDAIKGVWSDSRIELHFGKPEKIKKSFKLKESDNTYVFYTTPKNYTSDTNIFIPILIEVHNESNTSDKNIMVSFKYSKSHRPDPYIHLKQKNFGSRMNNDISHDINSNSEFILSNYKISYLPQYGHQTFTDGALTSKMNSSSLKGKVLLTTEQGIEFEIITYSEKDKERSYKFNYQGVKLNNSDELNYWVQRFYGTYIALNERKKNGFFEYLYKLLTSKKLVFYGINLSFDNYPINGTFIPIKDIDRYTAYIAEPYKWELLFKDKTSLPARAVNFILEKLD